MRTGFWRYAVAGIWLLLKETTNEWIEDRVPRLGAALAYYTIFAVVPLLIVVISVAGLFFGPQAAQGEILRQIGSLVGERSAATIQEMLRQAGQPKTGILGSIIGLGTLLLGASGVFGQLQDALNTVWGVRPKPGRGLMGIVRDRFLSFLTLMGTAFLLLVSLILSAALSVVGRTLRGFLPAPESILHALDFGLSFLVITLLFAMIFKILPDVKIRWKDVWIGAGVTALLFTVGKVAIGLYLGNTNVASVFGAAGSLVILLVWVYYSAQILLFGAEFTAVYANRYGSHVHPRPNAVFVTPEERAKQGIDPVANGRAKESFPAITTAPAVMVPTKAMPDSDVGAFMRRHPTVIVLGMAAWFLLSRRRY
jgi:membrane protein